MESNTSARSAHLPKSMDKQSSDIIRLSWAGLTMKTTASEKQVADFSLARVKREFIMSEGHSTSSILKAADVEINLIYLLILNT